STFQPGNMPTYFDFIRDTLHVTGSVNDCRKDTMEVKSVGANVQVSIHGQVVLTRPATGITRVFLNGSDDKDVLDASGYNGPVTLKVVCQTNERRANISANWS